MSQPNVFSSELLNPKRQSNETYPEYRARRKLAQRAVEEYQRRGTLVHVSSNALQMPDAGIDPKLDESIRDGRIRFVSRVVLHDGKVIRVGRSKGITYKRPTPKPVRPTFRKTGRG
jgi:hypothetical protein